jgi:hypothetical protein
VRGRKAFAIRSVPASSASRFTSAVASEASGIPRTIEPDTTDRSSATVETRPAMPVARMTVLPSGSSTCASTPATDVSPRAPTRSIVSVPAKTGTSRALTREITARCTAGTPRWTAKPSTTAATKTTIATSARATNATSQSALRIQNASPMPKAAAIGMVPKSLGWSP